MADRYDVIYPDFPWWYAKRRTDTKTRFGGGAERHYPLMKDAEILEMAPFIESLAAKNCALFMWSTGPRQDFAIQVLKACGFRYATVAFTWVKTTKKGGYIVGPGNYTGSNAEFVLLGIKGSMPPFEKLVPSVIAHPRLKHSEKLPIVRERIERMYPEAKRIELFSRHDVPGWDAWGNEVGKLSQAIPASG